MSDTTQALDEYAAAAQGLAIAAGGSALHKVLDHTAYDDPLSAMRDITRLLEKAHKATTCMIIAQKAEAEGDADLAKRSWEHALTTMNVLAVEASRPVSDRDAVPMPPASKSAAAPLAS